MIDKVLNDVVDMHAKALDKARDIVVDAETRYPARAWIGLGATLGAIVCALAAGFLLRDFGQRNFEYMPDMSYSEAWESQATHDYRSDYAKYTPELPPYIEQWGTADMPPPLGTIYRGQRVLDVAAGNENRPKAAGLANPYSGLDGAKREAVLKRGKDLFKFNCQGCHGVDGVGNAPVTKFGVGAPTIDNATVRDRYTDGEIFHIITHGINTMPAHKSHVDYDDRWKVITYLRELQKGK